MKEQKQLLPKFDLDKARAEFKLQYCEKLFESKKNSIFALEAFCIAADAKMKIPKSVLSWLSEGFKKYELSNGKEDLDRLLGFKKGKGPRGSAFEDEMFKYRDYLLCEELMLLKWIYGISILKASEMIEDRLREYPNPKEPEDIVAARRIQDIYSKLDGKKQHRIKYEKIRDSWTPQYKRDYLLRYPKDSIPLKVRNFHRIK